MRALVRRYEGTKVRRYEGPQLSRLLPRLTKILMNASGIEFKKFGRNWFPQDEVQSLYSVFQ